MRKSVIKSLVYGSLSVMLISMLIVTLLFFYSVRSNIINEAYSDMNNCIEHVKPLAQMSLDFSTSKMLRLFEASMQQFGHFTKYNLIVCETDGTLIWNDAGLSNSQFQKYIPRLTRLFSRQSVVRFSDVFNDIYKGRTISIGEVVRSDTSGKSWFIFCTAKSPSIAKRFADALLEILVMQLAALTFMAIFLYLITNKITSPLRKINNAVKAFTKGDFSRRVQYKSNNEIGELAANINAMADSIENLEKLRSDFVSDVSHELRTPMTSISGFVEGILDGTIPKDQSDKYLAIVLSECKRLSRLVNDFLNISRFDRGETSLNRSDFDILELARVILLKFETEITDKNINVEFESDSNHCIVNADKDLYTQVFTNLMHNAVKFTNSGGNIFLRLEENNKKCVFSIENSGPGIEPDKLNFIWERFYKTDNSRSTDKSGVGIGLYIVKKIIDSHGENISVTSTPGETTKFVFTAELSN